VAKQGLRVATCSASSILWMDRSLPRGCNAQRRDQMATKNKRVLVACWPWSGRYPLEVVGESHYAEALKSLPLPKGASASVLLGNARLVHKPDNIYDPNAMAVLIDDRQVGFLSRDDAVTYHRAFESRGVEERTSICNVLVSCSHLDTDDPRFSVQLDVDFAQDPSVSIRPAHRAMISLQDFVPIVVKSQGHGFIVAHWLPLKAVECCVPGESVSVWRRPGTSELHLFAPGSIGGSGRLAVIDEGLLAQFGIDSVERFHPIVYAAGRREVTVLMN
jgi:hypothetical protein